MTNTLDSRLDQQIKRTSLQDAQQQKQDAEFANAAAQNRQKNFQAVAQYNQSGAEQEKVQGDNQKMIGNVQVATGFAQIVMGGVMMAVGAAMNAIPGAGIPMITAGLGSIAKGGADVGMGSASIAQGNAALARAQEKLDLAVANNVMSKEEGIIAAREINRARIMQFKIELLEQMAEVVKPMLEKAGFNTEELNEEQLTKMIDKFAEDAAKSMANGGIMELDLEGADKEAKFTDSNGKELEGNFHFVRDEESGEFFKVELAYDNQGNPLKGALGEPLLDTSKGMVKVEDGDLKKYLELKFLFVDKMKLLSKELSYASADSAGNITFTPYDTKNIEHMREFADLVLKTNNEGIKKGEFASPRKYFSDENGGYFQEWDWKNDVALGPKVYLSELSGDTEDMRSDIENYQLALERSDTALRTLGLNSGGKAFETLSKSVYTGLSPKSSNSKFDNIASRDSQDFTNFKSVSSTFDILRSQTNVLEGSSADDLPEGLA
jgi:hypothetical protein